MKENKIVWGIIGCGDVAEVKSGPAFQKIQHSQLLAVMRRNASKAKDFADRHQVPLFYDKAEDLLANPEINAVYIATPPSSHLDYTLKSLEANKHVYLEKPMTMSADEAKKICEAVKQSNSKLSVAHYRRQLPAFLKVGELLHATAIGKPIFADIQILQPKSTKLIASSEENWRVDPDISGGGYFHDLAPHQLDLILHWFGCPISYRGSNNRSSMNLKVASTVSGIIGFENGIQFRGIWSFNVTADDAKDQCTIYGTEGRIEFSFYGENVSLNNNDGSQQFQFKNPTHIQQPMIEKVVEYFRGFSDNPCSAEEALKVMELMDAFAH